MQTAAYFVFALRHNDAVVFTLYGVPSVSMCRPHDQIKRAFKALGLPMPRAAEAYKEVEVLRKALQATPTPPESSRQRGSKRRAAADAEARNARLAPRRESARRGADNDNDGSSSASGDATAALSLIHI